jgi:hypothetical protein
MLGGSSMLLPAWQATHGHGVAGTFTVDQSDTCYKPCSGYGIFRSDDGTIVMDAYLDQAFIGEVHAGDVVRVRYAHALGRSDLFREDDLDAWHLPAVFAGVGAFAFLVGLLVIQPWTWVRRRRPLQPDPGRGGPPSSA